MFKTGDVVYFKKARTATKRSAQEGTFKGYGFGLYLGHVPPFAEDPPIHLVTRLLGTVGFITFDDIGEFLGNEAGAECVRKYEDKYYGKKLEDQEVRIGYLCPKCKSSQNLVIDGKDREAGVKKFSCGKCGFENEVTMTEGQPEDDAEVTVPEEPKAPPRLVGANGEPLP